MAENTLTAYRRIEARTAARAEGVRAATRDFLADIPLNVDDRTRGEILALVDIADEDVGTFADDVCSAFRQGYNARRGSLITKL